MTRTSLGIALMTAAALVVLIVATAGPAAATDVCSDQIVKCLARGSEFCRGGQNEAQCLIQSERACFHAYNRCVSHNPTPGSSTTTNVPPTDPTGTPPKGGLKPITGGGIKDPGGGSSPTKPKGGLEPIISGSTQQSGDGSGSGVTIYDKPGGGKSVTINVKNGATIATEFDGKGNSESTMTDPKGNILGKTTTRKVTPTGMTISTATDAKENLIGPTIGTPDKKRGYKFVTRDSNGKFISSAVIDRTGKIVSQKGEMKTLATGIGGSSSTGKGKEKVYLGEGSQKHKEALHEDKLKGKDKESTTTTTPAPTQSQHHGSGHR